MKKMVKIAAVLSAAMMVMGFVSCSNDDAEDLGTLLVIKDAQEKAETAAAAASEKSVATIVYDGSKEENVLGVTGDEGIFSDVQTSFAEAKVSSDFELDSELVANDNGTKSGGFPRWATANFTGDDGKTKVSKSGYTVASKQLADKIALKEGYVASYVTYKFTLAKSALVTVSVDAYNTQNGNIGGKIEVLDSSSAVKTLKAAKEGSKENDGITSDAVSLDAGTYTLKFSWIAVKDLEKAKGLKKVNGGISSVSLKAIAYE